MDGRSSVAAFLYHPGLRSREIEHCPRQRVPGGELGDVERGSSALRNIVCWMQRRGVAPHDGETGFLDATHGTVYTVDMVCEMEGKLTLVLIYTSERRGGEDWRQALTWARDMLFACRRTLNLLPRVVVLNVYGEDCYVRGVELDDTEDDGASKLA